MATDDEPQPLESSAAKWIAVLRCKLCERTSECPSADQIRSAQNEWPLCCGQVMEMFAWDEQPTAESSRDDTAIDPPPAPGVDGGRDADSYKLNPGGQRS